MSELTYIPCDDLAEEPLVGRARQSPLLPPGRVREAWKRRLREDVELQAADLCCFQKVEKDNTATRT